MRDDLQPGTESLLLSVCGLLALLTALLLPVLPEIGLFALLEAGAILAALVAWRMREGWPS